MSDLRTILDNTSQELTKVGRKVGICSARGNANVLPQDVYDVWRSYANFDIVLRQTISVLDCRDYAWKELKLLADTALAGLGKPIDDEVRFGGVQMPLSVARVLAIDSYLTSTWSVYDRLSNVLGRIIGNEGTRENPLGKSNPKLMEDFIGVKRSLDCFGLQTVLGKTYRQLIGFSYLMRNGFVHEGGDVDKVHILSGQTFGDAFKLDAATADQLNRAIENRYKMPNVTIIQQGDLCLQLQVCHQKLDNMFGSLLEFVIGSLMLEIEAFATVDGY